MKTITFIGSDHWHDGVPLVPGQTYTLPDDVAAALIALGKAPTVAPAAPAPAAKKGQS